jgi:hypothetical protein
MIIVYDKKGNEYKVPHKIDLKDWLDNGYFLEKPKPVKKVEDKE